MSLLPSEYIYSGVVITFEVNSVGKIVGWLSSEVNPEARVFIPNSNCGLEFKSTLHNAMDYVDGVWSY
jgi:hypothetical protein